MRIKKIAHLIFSMEIGGAQNLVVDIINHQSKTNSVHLFVVNNRVNHELISRISRDVVLHFINRTEGSKSDVASIIKLWLTLSKERPDILHCHEQNMIRILPFWRSKTVITVHDVSFPTSSLRLYRKIFSISYSVRENVINNLGLDSIVVSNGIDFSAFKRKNYVHKGLVRIIQVSRLDHVTKGQHLLIKAMNVIVNSLKIDDINVHFVGDGESKEYLEGLVKEYSLEEFVFFDGQKDRSWIMEKLSEYDALVRPSLNEGFGLTLLEGVAAGLPVIASELDGPAEILAGCPSGILVQPNNVQALVESVLKLKVSIESTSMSEACNNSISKLAEKYSIEATAELYLNAYGKVLAQ